LLALVDGETGVAALHRELLLQTVEALRLAGCRTVADTRSIASSSGQSRP
jgi:4-hydroxymandelate oxidase